MSPKTLPYLQAQKGVRPLSMVTCYDAAFAKIIDTTEMDMILVGDSLSSVVMGHSHTISATLEDMVRHTTYVTRIARSPFVVADLPFLSYTDTSTACMSAKRLIQEGGAQGVKLEGGKEVFDQVKVLSDFGVPVLGHLGLTPQSIHKLGRYSLQGDGASAQLLMDNALGLEQAGASMLVLEMVPSKLAKTLTAELKIPTIGIGAGPHCDGQVLVVHDLLGFDPRFNPKFLKKYARLGEIVKEALESYDQDVKTRSFPTSKHSFSSQGGIE